MQGCIEFCLAKRLRPLAFWDFATTDPFFDRDRSTCLQGCLPVAASFWQCFWWSNFAQLAEDRCCYRLIQKHKFCSILEIGLEDGTRSQRMIQVALRAAGIRPVHFFGIDLFEANTNPDYEALTLKEAHTRFSALGARVKLVPGDAYSALVRVANQLKDVELVVIGCEQNPEMLQKCWHYLPRVLAPNAIVLLQGDEAENFQFKEISLETVKELATRNKPKTKRAA